MSVIPYEQNVELIEKALLSDHPNDALEKLVLALSKTGEPKKTIYELFLDYHLSVRETQAYLQIEKDKGEYPVELIMDRLSGWCSEGAILLPEED
ncbi:MAG: hypothetical protein GY816_23500 [Cytophagales bacterium]|nr:hypothetical protein [Cytophagales bacterium]